MRAQPPLTAHPPAVTPAGAEPDGCGGPRNTYPPAALEEARAAIRKIDGGRHPVAMTFCAIHYGTGRFRDFINATDILLLDIYPIQQFSDSSGVCTDCYDGRNITTHIGLPQRRF